MENLETKVTVGIIASAIALWVVSFFLAPLVLVLGYDVLREITPLALPAISYWQMFWMRWAVVCVRKAILPSQPVSVPDSKK